MLEGVATQLVLCFPSPVPAEDVSAQRKGPFLCPLTIGCFLLIYTCSEVGLIWRESSCAQVEICALFGASRKLSRVAQIVVTYI